MDTINLYEAKTNLSHWSSARRPVRRSSSPKPARPLARLVPLAKRTTPRQLGLLAGQVWIG